MKRFFDFFISVILLIFLSPVIGIVFLLVRYNLGRPVFFKQVRPGLYGRPFTIYKFRTLADKKNHEGQLLPDEERLTRFGALLRKTSLDELPELLNVIRGDMSLVGPRPLLMEYLERYDEQQARRHDMKPGITGWAQINGRNAVSWPEKFKMDLWYIENHSLWLDIKILFLTLITVFKSEGITQNGHVTSEKFMGNTDYGQ